MEPDLFVSCPYNPQHRVPRLRIQYHIAKCQTKSAPLAICPYNATHRFPQANLQAHVRECPSKEPIMPDDHPPKVVASLSKPERILQKDYIPESDPNHEIWDN